VGYREEEIASTGMRIASVLVRISRTHTSIAIGPNRLTASFPIGSRTL